MPKLPLALVPVTLLLALGCAATQPATSGSAGPGRQADPAKAEKQALELEQARLQLRIAELEASFAASAAQEAAEEARREVEQAERALARFREYERPSELAEAQLTLERAEHSRRQDEAELQQMEEMYAQEANLDATGERTRDLVLERHRKALEFSTRQLELTRERLADQRTRVLPRKEQELEEALLKARTALRRAEEKQAKGALESELALLKASARVRELEGEGQPADEGGEGEGLEEGGR